MKCNSSIFFPVNYLNCYVIVELLIVLLLILEKKKKKVLKRLLRLKLNPSLDLELNVSKLKTVEAKIPT